MIDRAYLEDVIIGALKRHPSIDSFQVHATSTHELKSGFINENYGGIYRPVRNVDISGIDYLVKLTSGEYSLGSARFDMPIEGLLEQIINGAHSPKDLPVFAPKPKSYNPPQLFDPAIANIVNNEPARITSYTKEHQELQLTQGLNLTEGGVSFTTQQSCLISSEGVELEQSSTKEALYAYYDDRIGAGSTARALFSPSSFVEKSSLYASFVSKLDSKVTLETGRYPVLIDSDNGWSILDKFLLSNISGTLIDTGIAKYLPGDFKQNLQIAHDDFNLSFDQSQPMSTYSFGFSPQGVLGQKFDVIKNGRLLEPICDLKTALKLGYGAKALPSLASDNQFGLAYKEFAGKHPVFLLVLSVMGIYAANPVLGRYSLPAPEVLVVREGEIVGSINCILSGNFFDVLKQPSTGFVSAPHLFETPALTFETQVTVK